MATSQTEWPALDASYEDEYGPIDLKVYEAAKEIWPAAEVIGMFALHDQADSFRLMLNAAAKVSARMGSSGPKIENLKPYLFQTYKHLVGQEKAKRLRREQPLIDEDQSVVVDIVDDLERKILLRELFSRMSEAERTLSLYMMFGYTYSEIAEKMGTSPEALRSRFSRLKQRLEGALMPQKANETS